MSSAENDTHTSRLIHVDAADLTLHDSLLAQVVRVRHGRAPADPAEAAQTALGDYFGDQPEGWETLALDVLAALGVPSGVSRDATQPTSESIRDPEQA